MPKVACYIEVGATKNWMVLNKLFYIDYISQEGKIMDFLKYHEALDNKIKAQAKVIKVITGLTKLCLSPKTYMKKKNLSHGKMSTVGKAETQKQMNKQNLRVTKCPLSIFIGVLDYS